MARKMVNLVVILCMVFSLVGCANTSSSEIRLGVVCPITGQNAIAGKYITNGVKLAVSEFAKDGITIGGKKYTVKVIIEDNENKPEITANAFRKLIDQDKVVGIIGPDTSTAALAAGPIAQASKIPMIATFATNPKVTEAGDFIFRACFIDSFQGTVMAKYALNNLGVKKAAILYNNADAFSKGLAEFFTKAFEEGGGEVVCTQAYGGSDIKDFNAQLTNIKESGAEVLYLPSQFYEAGLQMTQARSMGITIPFLGADGWDNPELPKIAKGAEEGAAFTAAFSYEDQRPEVQTFVKKYKEVYGDIPNSNAVLAYEATAILLKGLQDAGTTDGVAVRDAIAKMNVQLPSGTIKFDENRNPQKPAVIMEWRNGERKYVTTVTP